MFGKKCSQDFDFVINSFRIIKLKNWKIWTYFASAEPFFTKIEAD
jgi:hypothetical protein